MNLRTAKTIQSDPINTKEQYSIQLFESINDIKQNYLSIDNIIRFQNKINYFSPDPVKPQDYLLILFDTETTGLQQENKLDFYTDQDNKKHEFISYRNQIVEMGAIAYDWRLGFETQSDKTFFHGKIKDVCLDEYNSIYKIESNLISKFNDLYLSNKENIIKAFQIAQGKAKYNPDYGLFKRIFPPIFDYLDDFNRETLIKYIYKYNLLITINEMNQSQKEFYKKPYNNDITYKVNNNYSDELNLIESFFTFVENKMNMYSNVIIGAHNLPYDEGMIRGAINTAIDRYTYLEEDTNMLNYYKNLLIRCDNVFKNKINTIDIFKDILNYRKYGNKILETYKKLNDLHKIKTVRHLVKALHRKKYSNGSYSLSLGNLAPLSLNVDFHTTINDIHVTMETLKLYFCIPIIIEYYDKIKISKKIREIIEKI
jgi:hypothetical protein